MASAIPEALRQQLEEKTGAVIVSEVARGGGGASRNGAEVMLRGADGAERHGWLAWDNRAGDPSRLAYFERETAILSALSGPFRDSGVRVAPLIAAFPSHLALLSEFVGGNDRFPQAEDKDGLARDFVGQLAALHRVDASHPALAALGDAAEPPSARIAANIAAWRAMNLAKGADPVLQIALHWLARNIPEDRGPAVVLHGDAGPGNFLFKGNRVAALVDWELTHLGDPMEDLAQIAVRSLIQPFVPMRDVFTAYEAASGTAVDAARVKFHRLYFQLSFTVPGATHGPPATGTALLFGTMHKRVIVRTVAELAGISVRDPALADVPAEAMDRTFQTALDDLKTDIVPAASNQRAAAKAKELARLVKYWRMRAACGAAYDAAELAETNALLRTSYATLAEARTALAQAIAAEAVEFAAAVQLCHARVTRETHVMADAMGALATTWYED
ncbi:MAG TPA: phosphotransferase family protein [Chakrabartia sp.]|jgi:hypothetical protein|nr:phosphotransferase family protein [Chakrabartia sp.]